MFQSMNDATCNKSNGKSIFDSILYSSNVNKEINTVLPFDFGLRRCDERK